MDQSLVGLFIPVHILEHFEYQGMEEISGCIYLICHEKSDALHIPKEIFKIGKAKLDGFANNVDIQTFPAQGKEVFIRLYRRKWRIKYIPKILEGKIQDKAYTNQYDFTADGAKVTKEFGAFLKGIGR
jgi:hypothetical protein